MYMKKQKSEIKILFMFFTGFCEAIPDQSFLVRPSDTSVVAHENVTLRCEILNQRGQAQWTQHGFAFGKFIRL